MVVRLYQSTEEQMTKTASWLATFVAVLGGVCMVMLLSVSVASADLELEEPFVCPEDGTREVLAGEGATLPDGVAAARAAADSCVRSRRCSGFGPVSCLGPIRDSEAFICRVCGVLFTPTAVCPDPGAREGENGDGPRPFEVICGGGSPLLIDLGGGGFELTSATAGVLFDIDADGELERVAWTQAKSGDAFLGLDRNGNGTIDDGGELFGNSTRLADGRFAKQGYQALAEFDDKRHGGNADGFIGPKDRAYRALVLWIDSNHNGTSEAHELSRLWQQHVFAIRLDYEESSDSDDHGNRFAYRSTAYQLRWGQIRELATTDVFLDYTSR